MKAVGELLMSISFSCPECTSQLHVPNDCAGKRGRCQSCGAELIIPAKEEVDPQPTSTSAQKTNVTRPETNSQEAQSPHQTIQVACPKCKRRFDVLFQGIKPDSKLHVACDHCGLEKKLSSFQKEMSHQERVEREHRQAEEAARQLAAVAERERQSLRELQDAVTGARSIGQASPISEIVFEGEFTPNVALLPDERALDTYEASAWDLGFLGWLLGHKRRLVLTTHRLIHFHKRIISNTLSIIWLRQTRAIAVGQQLKPLQFIAGMILAAATFVLRLLMKPDQTVPWAISDLLPLIAVAIGFVLMFTARTKVLMLSAGHDRITIRLTRMKTEESKRFIDRVFNSLWDLQQ